MDKVFKTILPSKKQMNGSASDIFLDLDIKNNTEEVPLTENLNSILSLSELLTQEREQSRKYYINGVVDVVAPFINTYTGSTTVNDLFNTFNGIDNKNNFYKTTDFFNIHLCIPTKLVSTQTTNQYSLYLKSIQSSLVRKEILFNEAGFSTNLFGETINQFISKKPIDIDSYDNLVSDDEKLILPVTNLYVYFEFITGRTDGYNISNTNNNVNNLYYSDIIFDENEFTFTETNNYVETLNNKITSGSTTLYLQYLYNPFYKIKIKDYDIDVEFGNIVNETNIPFYATILSDTTNNYQPIRNEVFTINEFPIHSGTTRLTRTDSLNLQPRKFMFDTNINGFVYYLDSPIYDLSRVKIFYSKYFDLNTKIELSYYNDYFTDNPNVFDGINKLIIKNNNNFNLGDRFYVLYYTGTNYVWKDLLQNGILDTDNGLGVNYPFVNGYHYISENIKLFIKPNMNNADTYSLYNKFEFSNDTVNNKLNPNFNQDC